MSIQNPAADPRMASNIVNSLRLMGPDELAKFGEMHKADPYLLSLAFNESNFRAAVPRNQQMQGGQNPPVNEQIVANMQAKAAPRQPMPEEVGIGTLPERSLARMAGGGIVAFADGGPSGSAPSFDEALDIEGVTDPTQRAFLKSLYAQESSSGKKATTSNRGAMGGMQILPGTFKEVADPGMDIRNPLDNMRAGIRYGMKGYQAAKGDPVLAGAHYYGGPGGLQALAAGAARKDPVNPTAPDTRQYGESIAKRMTSLLPIGSAQAATPAQAAPAQAASTDDGTVYDPMTGVPIYQGTPTTYEESPGKILKQIASPVVKGVTKAAKFITSAPKTAAEIAEEREPFSTGEYRGKSGDVEEDIGPSVKELPSAQKRELIAAAKESVPEGADTKGWTAEDWLTLGFSLLSSKSPRIAEAAGEAGLKVLAGQQARAKTGLEALKTKQDIEASKALARYHTAGAQRYEAEDKPTAQLRKEIAAAYLKLEADPLLKFDPVKLAAEKRRVAAELTANYPELAGTIGQAPSTGRVIDFNTIG